MTRLFPAGQLTDINFFLPQIRANLGILCFHENTLPRNEFISRK